MPSRGGPLLRGPGDMPRFAWAPRLGPGDIDLPIPGDIGRPWGGPRIAGLIERLFGPGPIAGLIERPLGPMAGLIGRPLGPIAGLIGRPPLEAGAGRGFDGLAARHVRGTAP